MKKHIVSLLLVLLGLAAYSNAQDVMVVEKKDMTTVKYNVDDVQRVYFESRQGEPSFTFTPSTESGGASATGVSNLTQTGVTISAQVTISNTTGTYYCGIAIDKTSSVSATNYIDKKTNTYSGNGTKTVSYSFSGLSSSTTYYYVVYILYGGKYYYGAVKSFTTSSQNFSCTATTGDATNITETTAKLPGSFVVNNATKSYTVGFLLSTNSLPTSANAMKNLYKSLSDANYNADLYGNVTGLTANTKYYFRAYILYDGDYTYGTTKSFTTNSSTPVTTGTLNGHAWVDLGLPDGTKWATCNVGASTPEGYGDYYAWGETATKSIYDNSTWQYHNVNLGADIAGTQYDVAHVKWGSTWKMPSNAQVMTLINNCNYAWTTQNGVTGMKFIGPNGNSVFFPAAGVKGMGPGNTPSYSEVGTAGYYWQSTNDDVLNSNIDLMIDNSGPHGLAGRGGMHGCTIRPVTE